MPTETTSQTYDAQLAAQNNAGSIIADAALISGKVQFLQCELTTPVGGGGAADTILLGYLPKGAVVLPGASSVCVPAAAGSGTLAIGIATDDDAIAPAVSIASAGTFPLTTSLVSSFESTSRQVLVATQSGAVTASKKVYINIAYVFAE
jgi:hypothetical protein